VAPLVGAILAVLVHMAVRGRDKALEELAEKQRPGTAAAEAGTADPRG
jgi:hypothetical protein